MSVTFKVEGKTITVSWDEFEKILAGRGIENVEVGNIWEASHA